MNREELKEKLELARVGNGTQTYNDVVLTLSKEETLELCKYIEKLEKELKQTKLNFKNSQTHSKNCYKKLKEKFERGKEVYHRNYELIQENGKLKQENQGVKDDNTRLWHSLECANNENAKLKKALNIISTKYVNEYIIRYKTKSYEEYNFLVNGDLTKEEYELLKEVFKSVGDSDE